MCSRYGRQKRLCADGIGPICGQDEGPENGAVFADQDVKTVAGGAFIAGGRRMRAAEGAFNEGRLDQADRGFVLGALEQGLCGLQGTGLRPAAHLRKDRSPGREVMRQAAPATPHCAGNKRWH